MNEHYKHAERIIKEVIDDLKRFLPEDSGENISYYFSHALDEAIMNLINAKEQMARAEMIKE